MARRPRTPVTGAPGISRYIDADGRKRFVVRYRTAEGKSTDKQGFATLTAARNFQATVRVGIAGGTFTPEAKRATKIATLYPAFIATKQHLRPRSLRNINSAWETHVEPRWGHIAVGRITRATAQEWINELSKSLSASRVKEIAACLSGILRVAVADGVIPTVPTVGVVTPRKRGKMRRRYLTPKEANRLFTVESGTVLGG